MSLQQSELQLEHRPPREGRLGRWGQERRLEFIDFRLCWEGRLNRGELVDFFGISIQQASLDISRYIEIAPDNLIYNKSEKAYRSTPNFVPALTSDNPHAFLDQVLGVATETVSPASSFVGFQPPTDVVQYPTRKIAPKTLMSINQAIRDKLDIEFSYQSMRRPTASRRWIAPRAVAFDGARWHVRAFCYENQDFRDFVLSRVLQIHSSRASQSLGDPDSRWDSFTTVILQPRRDLTDQQRRAVELDFDMADGQLRVSMREALVFYFLRQLHLVPDSASQASPQPIEWVNAEELRPILDEASKT